jgi:hypothetical protein
MQEMACVEREVREWKKIKAQLQQKWKRICKVSGSVVERCWRSMSPVSSPWPVVPEATS